MKDPYLESREEEVLLLALFRKRAKQDALQLPISEGFRKQ
jgi:hypothetical protein